MKLINTVILALLVGSVLFAQLPNDALLPGYRSVEASVPSNYNPFEPIRNAQTDASDELVEAFVKRLKGYVIQSTGVPLLVIDDASYKVGDRVNIGAGISDDADDAQEDDQQESNSDVAETAEEVGSSEEYATIVSISPTEAIFKKEDTTGFGGEVFKIYYNFSHITDDEGRSMYDVWEPVATGFFVSEDGLVVAPLDVVASGEFSVQTQNGPRKAILVESDELTGLALMKVGYKAIPLKIAPDAPQMAQPVYPVGYLPQKTSTLKYMEGFVGYQEDDYFEIRPLVNGEFVGSPVLNRHGEVTGILVGTSQELEEVATLSETSEIFAKFPLPEDSIKAQTRSTIEQSVVQILKKR